MKKTVLMFVALACLILSPQVVPACDMPCCPDSDCSQQMDCSPRDSAQAVFPEAASIPDAHAAGMQALQLTSLEPPMLDQPALNIESSGPPVRLFLTLLSLRI